MTNISFSVLRGNAELPHAERQKAYSILARAAQELRDAGFSVTTSPDVGQPGQETATDTGADLANPAYRPGQRRSTTTSPTGTTTTSTTNPDDAAPDADAQDREDRRRSP